MRRKTLSSKAKEHDVSPQSHAIGNQQNIPVGTLQMLDHNEASGTRLNVGWGNKFHAVARGAPLDFLDGLPLVRRRIEFKRSRTIEFCILWHLNLSGHVVFSMVSLSCLGSFCPGGERNKAITATLLIGQILKFYRDSWYGAFFYGRHMCHAIMKFGGNNVPRRGMPPSCSRLWWFSQAVGVFVDSFWQRGDSRFGRQRGQMKGFLALSPAQVNL